MATSQNGWPVIFSDNGKNLARIPKIIGKVKAGDVATIFTHLIAFVDEHVEDLDKGADEWGHNVRAIRGQTTGYSNHASGTAIDLDAMRHPRGKEGTWTAAQEALIHAYLRNTLGGVVRWGQDYNRSLSIVDGMHFEINAGSAAVHRVAEALRAGKSAGTKPSAPASKPASKVAAQSAKNPPNGSTRFPTNYADVPVNGKRDALTVGAHQVLMHAIGRKRNGRWDGKFAALTIRDTQEWMRGLGYYVKAPVTKWGVKKGTPFRVDGVAGRWFWYEFQRLLKARGLYKGLLDGDPKGQTVRAWQAYLNKNNG